MDNKNGLKFTSSDGEFSPVEFDCWGCGKEMSAVPFGYDDGEPLIDNNERYCPKCLDRRLKNLERAREYESDVPPSWFDPTYAGERWGEDY